MGAELGEVKRSRPSGKTTFAEDWYRGVMRKQVGSPIEKVLPEDDMPANLSKGWVIVQPEKSLLQSMHGLVIILGIEEPVSPDSDGQSAQDQMRAWEEELGGKVIYLLVQDTAQKDGPWLAQPVLTEWLGYSPESLLTFCQSEPPETPRALRYRAAYIAKTGNKPEDAQEVS